MGLVSIVMVVLLLVFITYRVIKSNVIDKRANRNKLINYAKFNRKISKPFSNVLDRLESSLDVDYMERVKERVLKDNPNWTPEVVDTGIVKLKHFLVMSTMFKNVPMFDDVADEVWHTMILFTGSYADFCAKFNGGYIHHEPTIGKEVDMYELDRLHTMEYVLYGNLDTFKPKKDYFGYVNGRTIFELSDIFLNEESEYVEDVLLKLRDLFDAMFVAYVDNEKKNNREPIVMYSPSPVLADSLRKSSDQSKASSNYTTTSDASMMAFMIPILLSSDVDAEDRHSHCTANSCVASCGSNSGGGSGDSGGGSSCNSSSCNSSRCSSSSCSSSSCGSSCGSS